MQGRVAYTNSSKRLTMSPLSFVRDPVILFVTFSEELWMMLLLLNKSGRCHMLELRNKNVKNEVAFL